MTGQQGSRGERALEKAKRDEVGEDESGGEIRHAFETVAMRDILLIPY